MYRSRTFYTRKVLEVPYDHYMEAGEIREFLAGVHDSARVDIDGGDDFSEGHNLTLSLSRPSTYQERVGAIRTIQEYRRSRVEYFKCASAARDARKAYEDAADVRRGLTGEATAEARDQAAMTVWRATEHLESAISIRDRAYFDSVRARNNIHAHYKTHFTDGV